MLDAHARRLRRVRARRRVIVPLAVGTIVVAAVLVGIGWPTVFVLMGTFLVLAILGCEGFVREDDAERPRPDTALEVAVVVGVEITSWAHAEQEMHDVRVIARPLGSATDQLVHGYRRFPAARGCRIAPGMVFGFRRYPTMAHLVWIEPDVDPLALVGLRAGTEEALRSGGEDAEVESVAIEDEPDGDWWVTAVEVRTGNGERLTERTHRLPEELAQFGTGERVRIVRDGSACLIVPRTF
ncbi:hypothetical protein [Actinomadura atramentaria]|uniref:hypothetical protein n=1 Tax=Actinomadura atramentaria TaxID=1990 RepID=UPI0012F87509|nr:hypothetical protein [Actinomadura atramentaria]